MSIANLAVAESALVLVKDLPLERPRKSGFVLKPVDVAAATAALQSLYFDDETEQRETFAYLRDALNETRAANNERLLFPYEPDHLA